MGNCIEAQLANINQRYVLNHGEGVFSDKIDKCISADCSMVYAERNVYRLDTEEIWLPGSAAEQNCSHNCQVFEFHTQSVSFLRRSKLVKPKVCYSI